MASVLPRTKKVLSTSQVSHRQLQLHCDKAECSLLWHGKAKQKGRKTLVNDAQLSHFNYLTTQIGRDFVNDISQVIPPGHGLIRPVTGHWRGRLEHWVGERFSWCPAGSMLANILNSSEHLITYWEVASRQKACLWGPNLSSAASWPLFCCWDKHCSEKCRRVCSFGLRGPGGSESTLVHEEQEAERLHPQQQTPEKRTRSRAKLYPLNTHPQQHTSCSKASLPKPPPKSTSHWGEMLA